MNFHRDDSKSSHLIPPPSYIGQHPPYTAHVFRNYFLQADPQNFCGTRRVYKLGKPCAVKQQKTFHSVCMLNYYPRRICEREQGERQWYSINVLHLCKCKPSLSLWQYWQSFHNVQLRISLFKQECREPFFPDPERETTVTALQKLNKLAYCLSMISKYKWHVRKEGQICGLGFACFWGVVYFFLFSIFGNLPTQHINE